MISGAILNLISQFPFSGWRFPPAYLIHISIIRFARVSSDLNDFNCSKKANTATLLKKDHRYFKLRKALLKFYRRHSALVKKI